MDEQTARRFLLFILGCCAVLLVAAVANGQPEILLSLIVPVTALIARWAWAARSFRR